jgi:hypothetical protein
MYKRDIVNFLFLISFPVYGLGTYFSAVYSPSIGYVISISPHFLIILFYFIDLLYSREFEVRLNPNYFLMLLFVIASIASLFIALSKGLPEATMALTITKSLLVIVPFHSFLMMLLYNERKGSLVKLTLWSLSLLLAINIFGFFVLGLSNGLHSIEGRLNFPFLDGFYSGACLLAIIDLLLLHYLAKAWGDPWKFTWLSIYFSCNLILFLLINSRLTILIFMLVLVLCIVRLIRMRGLYLASMFTIPILLSSGFLIYQILQLPGLSSVLQRVDLKDVTTFNGRAYLWTDAMNWLMDDQRGLIFGNGHRGHYFLDMVRDVAKLWNEKDVHHLHLHSTSLEILVSQGVVFFLLFAFLFYRVYVHFRSTHKVEKEDGAFLPVVVFLLFLMQVDNFLYVDGLGFVIFSLLVSKIAITSKAPVKRSSGPIDLLDNGDFSLKKQRWMPA